MNFIEDVMERSKASRLGIVAIDSEGFRREWHFGELIAAVAAIPARALGRSQTLRLDHFFFFFLHFFFAELADRLCFLHFAACGAGAGGTAVGPPPAGGGIGSANF
jgi:hypothetical protein